MSEKIENVYIRLRGGLGNQLFQYAYALALDKNYSANKILDVREYKTYKIRNFEIRDFVLDNQTFISQEDKLKYDRKFKKFHIYQYLYRILLKKPLRKINLKMAEKGFIFSGRSGDIPNIELPQNIYLYGYFQNVKPLLPIRNKIIECFTLAHKDECFNHYNNLIENDSVAVSIRCGQDAAHVYTLPPKEYYLSSLDYLCGMQIDKQIVVYSDCINKIIAEKWFDKYKNVLYVENCTPCMQLELMKKSQDYIISNSSFSWWGAFLGFKDSISRICAPRVWYEDIKIQNTDIYYNAMTVL